MDKPIYRYLSRRAWELTTLPILTQRLTQMHVIPDLLPHLKPVTGSTLSWNSTPIEPGAFVRSSTSAVPPTLQITSFAQAPRLLSIVVTDPDVPDLQRDGFTEQVLYYAANIEVDAFSGAIELADPAPGTEAEVLIEWTPPVVQKGSPYHRLCVLVLEQQDGVIRRAEALEKLWGGSGAEQGTAGKDGAGSPTAAPRATFAMCRAVTPSRPIGANLFRAVWDEDTEAVMRSIGSDLIDTELRRERFYSPAKARVIERRKENMKR